MGISDWSSDVCSSDLVQAAEHRVAVAVGHAGPVVDGGQAVDVAAVDRRGHLEDQVAQAARAAARPGLAAVHRRMYRRRGTLGGTDIRAGAIDVDRVAVGPDAAPDLSLAGQRPERGHECQYKRARHRRTEEKEAAR